MARPRTALAAVAPEPDPADTPSPPQAAPVAAVEPEATPEQPLRTPERQRLADAIERLRALEAEVIDAGAAVDEARSAQWPAQRKLDEAEEQLRRSTPREPEAYGQRLPPAFAPARSFWSETSGTAEEAASKAATLATPPLPIGEARAQLAAAKDDLGSARRLFQHHEERLKAAQDRLSMYRGSVGDAVKAVIRADPAFLALAVESRRLATRAEAARRAFEAVTGSAIMQPGSPFYGAGRAADWRDPSPEAEADRAVEGRWRAALAQLAADPDTPLPAV